MHILPHVGDHVRIPLGVDQIDAEVVDVYDFGIGSRVQVEFFPQCVDEPLLVTLPVEAVEAVEPVDSAGPESA